MHQVIYINFNENTHGDIFSGKNFDFFDCV